MPPTTSSVGTISGFSILPVQYDHATHHMLYIRAHWPEGRTMFMVNVPPDATEREIVLALQIAPDDDNGSETSQPRARKRTTQVQLLTKAHGQMSSPFQLSHIAPLRRTGHTAHILFLDASSVHARAGPSATRWASPYRLAHYVLQYEAGRPSLDAVRAHGDSAVARPPCAANPKYKKGEALVDEDGFTLVVRGGAYGQAVGGGVGVASRKFMDERVKRKGHKEGNTFYAFQIHEKKRDALLELKRKWEEDKAAVEKLKSSKKFKPY
ncbi:ribosomal RNA-processing protein 7-domain-containing protein [Lactarius sanguifluus]|nr:ribosomal RNA-processing protein 7-domain-containing protein [Lactarius sanguifluus]